MQFRTLLTTAIALAFTLLGCFDTSFEPVWPNPGTVVAKAVAPDETAVAILISKQEEWTYTFEIRDAESGDPLAQREITAPIGHHEHVVSIHWVDSRRAEVTIDRDFGDNNIQVILSY